MKSSFARRRANAKNSRPEYQPLEPRKMLAQVVVADYVDNFSSPEPNGVWQYLWNESGQFGEESSYASMQWDSWRYRPTNADFPYLGATFGHPGPGLDNEISPGVPNTIERFAIAAHTVSESGEYSIGNSLITREGAFGDGIEVSVHVNGQPVTNLLQVGPTESGSFDTSLGTLSAGDTVYVGVGPDGPGNGSSVGNDGFSWDFSILMETDPVIPGEVTVSVQVDLDTQRYVGDVSALDREKFFSFHSGSTNDAQISAFMQEYDVTLGRQFWGALPYAKSQTGQVGVYPNVTPSTNQSVMPTTRIVQTGHPRDALTWTTDVQEAADWVTTYYTTVVNTVPEFLEPMNEPFVHAGDSEFSDAPSTAAMRQKMAELYAAIGEAVDQTPALANMNVVGYGSAWPSMELWDFGHWDSRMKMFMDVAGEHMDAFSTHLYDGVNVTGQNNRRSGSNSEAILDLIETYSYSKWGTVKPHAITEYGGIEQGYGDAYSDLRSAQSVRSINHVLFNLLEREDDLLVSIPFITDKSTWFLNSANNYEPYGAALWRPTGANGTGPFEYTWKIHFFDLWKDVKGDRGLIETSDPDVQAQLFVDGSTAYVAINNLADGTETVGLEFLSGLSGFQNVEIRKMEVPVNGTPLYTETTETTAPESVTLETGGTTVLVYNFDAPLEFEQTVRSEKYYTSQHLQTISAGQAITFNFDGVQTASEGDALLRMGLGRKHNRSKAPTVTVNGTAVDVPNDWKGYDQANRDDFFGVIEIPVPIELLNANNTVTLTFPDSGGRVSSMILNVESVEAAPEPTEVTALVRDGQFAQDIHLLDRPDQLGVISVQFNQAVNVEVNDLTMTHDSSGGQVVNLSSANFSYDSNNHIATWDLGATAEFLPVGYYTATVSASGISPVGSGPGMAQDYTQQLYKAIPGDANFDGNVNVLGDGFALVGNLGLTGNATWSQGDFNGDGNVNVLGDGFVLVGNLGQSAIPPAASQAFVSTSAISDQPLDIASEPLQRDIAFAADYGWIDSEEQRKKRLAKFRSRELDSDLSAEDLDAVFQLS